MTTLPAARAALLASALLIASIGGCARGSAESPPPAAAERVTPVRVAEVGRADGGRELRLPGVLRAIERAEPAFLHPGHLAERFVARGEHVRTGQRLASIQNPALAPALAVAEARVRELDERLVQLDADYRRAEDLSQRGLAAAELLDRTLAERNTTRQARAQAVARLAEARDQLSEAILRAPFDGVVSELLVEPGDFVAAGQPVLSLAGESGLEVEVTLPEGLARRLAPGMPVELRAVMSGELANGRLRELGQARPGRPAPAVITVESAPDWEPGMSVHATLAHAGEAVLTVPLSAIVAPGTGQTRVFRVRADRVERVAVTVGRLAGARVEVSGDLQAGDHVVIAGHQQLLDGEAVRILP